MPRPVVVLFMLLTSHHLVKSNLTNWTSCTPVCTCARDSSGLLHARCDVNMLPDTNLLLLSTAHNLYSLSIENTKIHRVPAGSFQGLQSLRELFLDNNSITTIDEGAFITLDNLNLISLRENSLQTWKLKANKVLPSLQTIHASGNSEWVPDENLLSLRKLKEITGLKWSGVCRDCTLLKTKENENHQRKDMFDNDTVFSMACDVTLNTFFIHHDEVTYGKAYEFVKLGFSPQCLCNSQECFNKEVTHLYFQQLYDIPKKLFYSQYILGTILLVINLTVVVIVLRSRSLRTNSSFILICSMAMSDVLIGLYTVGIAVFNPFTKSTVIPTKMMSNVFSVCPYLGFVFTTGQTTTAFTSLFMTVERYLAIVHCDKPTLRMTTKVTLILTSIIWMLGVVYAVLPIFGVKQLQYHMWFQCTMPFHAESTGFLADTSTVTLVIAIGFVLVYLSSVALYIKIYFYVRIASANFSVGVRREARLAKRIALVVCTNFTFFVVPTVLFLVYVYRFMDVLFDVASTFLSLRSFIIMGSWLPVTLLGISSFLNPILYAFRHQKFQREVKRLTRRVNSNIRDSMVSQESRIRPKIPSCRSPTCETKRQLLKNVNRENTMELELNEVSNFQK